MASIVHFGLLQSAVTKLRSNAVRLILPLMNARTRLSAKGQVVIPKDLRERLCWAEGDRLDVIPTADGVLLRRYASSGKTITVDEFMKLMPSYSGPPATLEDMEEAIERGRAERWAAKEARSR